MTESGGMTIRRYLRGAAGVITAAALALWLQPINVPGGNLEPFSCGSAASPAGGDLATFVCGADLGNRRLVVAALLLSVAVILALGEILLGRWDSSRWVRGTLVVLPVAIPLLLLSVAGAFATVGSVRADGTLIRCGSVVAPATDALSVAVCGDLPGERRIRALGSAAVSIGVLLAGAYVTHRPPDERESQTNAAPDDRDSGRHT